MPYITGSAINMGAVRDALFSACSDNGFSLSGDVLHKGACYVRVQLVSGHLRFRGGAGVDGSNNLLNQGPADVQIYAGAQWGITWPLVYHIFILTDPDEVYLVLNYATNAYQWAALGVSDVPGLPSSGVWYGASHNVNTSVTVNFTVGATAGSFVYACPAPFWRRWAFQGGGLYSECAVRHGFDGASWSTGLTDQAISALEAGITHLQRLPNAWNSDGVLLPIQVMLQRPSAKVSVIADLRHARHTRIDNYDPEQIIVLGPDRWMVFPFFRKSSTQRNGMTAQSEVFENIHTGTAGWAIRYDGP